MIVAERERDAFNRGQLYQCQRAESAERERDEAVSALEPFDRALDAADVNAADMIAHKMGKMTDTMTIGWGINYGHLKAVRKALTTIKGPLRISPVTQDELDDCYGPRNATIKEPKP